MISLLKLAVRRLEKGHLLIYKEIDDTDLKNPAIGRLLLDERDRLLSEKVLLEGYREKYYDSDKKASVLEEV